MKKGLHLAMKAFYFVCRPRALLRLWLRHETELCQAASLRIGHHFGDAFICNLAIRAQMQFRLRLTFCRLGDTGLQLVTCHRVVIPQDRNVALDLSLIHI